MGLKVLIAEDDALVARLLQQSLQKAGHTVDVAADGMAARERLLKGSYGALVTDWMMPELDGIELVRLVRAKRDPCYVALVTELNIPAARAHALQQGADDFFAKPVVPTEIVHSLVKWLDRRARGGSSAEITPVSPTSTTEAVPHPVARTAAWGALPATFRQVMSDAVQVAFTRGQAWAHAPADGVTCMLPMVDVEHLLEFHVMVEVPRASALEIARAMLGEAEPDDVQTLRDVVSELANMAAGTVKTAFADEGFHFTLGLAKAIELSEEPYVLAGAVGLKAAGVDLVVRAGVRPRNGTLVQPAQLREGMVLAENAFSPAGGLLLPAGTRLTATAAERLRGSLKGRPVKVCVPDAPTT